MFDFLHNYICFLSLPVYRKLSVHKVENESEKQTCK
jgi:hypothetical protein